jgi:dTDP-4-amino-4,6-dideoxygalactose transaminase
MLKTDITQLAICGAPPAFESPLHVGRPNLCDREQLKAELDAIFDRRWLTNRGPLVQAFESALAERLGVRHCIAVCNATLGLEVVLRALEVSGEVVVPSFTFIATAHAARWLGLRPVFVDVDRQTHNIDPAAVDAALSPQTGAIMGVHLWGRPCDVSALTQIARARGIPLLFDAAHAFSCEYHGVKIGNFGDAEVFSFHATKFLNSFEGGAIATNSDVLAATVRLMINFGFSGYDCVDSIGTNAKMSEISAAMGLLSLGQIDALLRTNRLNHGKYLDVLQSLPGVTPIRYDEADAPNYQYVIVEVDEGAAGLSRDDLVAVLWAEQVFARRYFYPGCHRMEPYASEHRRDARLPNTEALCDRVLALPTGTAVDARSIEAIGAILRTALAQPEAVRRHLPGLTTTSP